MKFSKVQLRLSSQSQVFFAFVLASVIAILLFYKRFLFPDVAFDTLNYHFSLGFRGFNNFPMLIPFNEGEFFPLGMHSFNPIVDSIAVVLYQIFGYRFGTLVSLVALVVSFYLTLRIIVFLNPVRKWLLFPFLVSVFVVNEAYFQVATYFTDNVFTLFTLSSLFFLYRISEYGRSNISKEELNFLFLLVISLAILSAKLTNAFYILPLFSSLVVIYFNRGLKLGEWLKVFLVFFCVFSLVVFFNWIVVYFYSGNPIFPYYNSIFNSDYYPTQSWPFNFGPKSISQRLFYPFYALIDPYLLGEVKDFFPDLKLVYLFCVFVFLVVLQRKRIQFLSREWLLYYITFFSFLLWQSVFGYTRYAIALELLLGVSLYTLLNKMWESKLFTVKLLMLGSSAFFSYLSYNIIQFNFKYDIAWRPNISISDVHKFIPNTPLYSKNTMLSKELSERLTVVDFVGQCVNPSSGYIYTIEPLKNKIVMNFDVGWNGAMTKDENFTRRRNSEFINYINNVKESYEFVMLFNNDNSGWNSRKQCYKALDEARMLGEKLVIDDELEIDNFVGDSSKKIGVIFGRYFINNN